MAPPPTASGTATPTTCASPGSATHRRLSGRALGADLLDQAVIEALLATFQQTDLFEQAMAASRTQAETLHEQHQAELATVTEQIRKAEATIERYLGLGAAHVCLTRWEEDSLTLFLNSERAFAMHLAQPGDGGVQACDLNWLRSDQAATFTCRCGIGLTFEYAMTIPKHLASEVTGHYLHTGRLPEWVPWHHSLDGVEPDPSTLARSAEHATALRAARGELPIPGILDDL